jgi:hypothetical protein
MTLLGPFVAHRFSAQQPPHWLKGAVASGELAPESLDIWATIAGELGRNFETAAAVSYWENEMRSLGLPLPRKLIPPLDSEVESDETVGEWREQFVNSTAMRTNLEGKARQLGESDLETILSRHQTHRNPTVEFEKQYQFHLILIRKHLAKKSDDPSWSERLEALMRKVDKLLSQAGA